MLDTPSCVVDGGARAAREINFRGNTRAQRAKKFCSRDAPITDFRPPVTRDYNIFGPRDENLFCPRSVPVSPGPPKGGGRLAVSFRSGKVCC